MPDPSLPYLINIAITAKVPNETDKVVVTVTWQVALATPPLVEIYALFGASGGNLLDIGNRVEQIPVGSSQPRTITFTRPNHDPYVAIGVAPRTLDADGMVANMMPDATNEEQPWESFASQEGFALTYSAPPPAPPPAPPLINVVSVTKTLQDGDYLAVTVSAPNANDYNLIVNDGEDGAQLENSDGLFKIPATPGRRYWLRAQELNKGNGNVPPQWSLFSTPREFDASPRQRSLRNFLSLSGVLNSGTGVRQYASGGSIRRMMGL